MSSAPTWHDWQTDSGFRIRVSLSAAEKLRQLSSKLQAKIKEMLEEIAEVASASRLDRTLSNFAFGRPLLQLRIGRVTVHYAIDEDTSTLAVEHVVVGGEATDSNGISQVGSG